MCWRWDVRRWSPHRISLRLTARLLRLPLKGGVIANAILAIWVRHRQVPVRSLPAIAGRAAVAIPTLLSRTHGKFTIHDT